VKVKDMQSAEEGCYIKITGAEGKAGHFSSICKVKSIEFEILNAIQTMLS
jgi:hypothetical protein